MKDTLSQKPIPGLNPPKKFANGEVVAAIRCPVDPSLGRWRHAIVVKHDSGRMNGQAFSFHVVDHNGTGWTAGQGHYELGYADAIRRMADAVAGPAYSGGDPETIASVTGTIPCTVYHGTNGSSILLADEDRYVISVDEEGRTNSGYIVHMSPEDILNGAPGFDVSDISGWTTGWEA